uniref:tyrosine-type recombinase/integrase n=1 Tax=Gilliamella sp. Nev6-6 TaxID=3120252 RepID=UPI001C536778|nr:tyrosine-type recombinase/integrase [Gilliamella apicola]
MIICRDWLSQYERILLKKNLNVRTIYEKQRFLRVVDNKIGDLKLNDVKPIHLKEIINNYVLADKSSAAKSMHSLLKDAFNEAIIYGYIDSNPIWPLKYPAQRVKRARLLFDEFLTLADRARQDCHEYLYNMLMLTIITAQRPSDVLKMGVNQEDYFIKDDHLFIHQQKGRKYINIDGEQKLIKFGSKIALPLDLRLNVIDMSLRDIIEISDGEQYFIEYKNKSVEYWRVNRDFCKLRDKIFSKDYWRDYNPPSFFEIRSLAERLYRQQGVNTQVLLGHKYSTTTELYNDLRGREWQHLRI